MLDITEKIAKIQKSKIDEDDPERLAKFQDLEKYLKWECIAVNVFLWFAKMVNHLYPSEKKKFLHHYGLWTLFEPDVPEMSLDE